MTVWEALLLGLLQGSTEFLPVSSSGHLALTELLLRLKPNLAFNAALHGGTLLVVVGYYRRDLLGMFADLFQSIRALPSGGVSRIWAEDHGTRLALLLCAGSVPTAIIGLGLKSTVERAMSSGVATSAALLVTGLLLLATWRVSKDTQPADVDSSDPAVPVGPTSITLAMALLIGIAQGLAVIPGISRSGATLAAALLLGAGRADAARFCFLLSVPAILGALVLESGELVNLGRLGLPALLVGVGMAVVAGYASLALLVALVKRGGLHRFAFYVLPVGLAGLIYFGLQ